MADRKTHATIPDLPGDIREAIRRETDEGLATFRAGNFEGRLSRALRDQETAPARRTRVPRWAPALGLAAVALAAIGAAVLWFGRSPRPAPAEWAWVDAFGKMPGFRTLDASARTAPSPDAPDGSGFESAIRKAASGAAPRPTAPEIPNAGGYAPRYSLDQKIEILYGDKAIERALASFARHPKEG